MSAQRRPDYTISPPRKETASKHLRRFCSGALIYCSMLVSITACQSNSQNNSSVKDSTVESANSVANQPSVLRFPQVDIAEESPTLQPSLPTSKAESTSAANPESTAKIHQANRVKNSAQRSNTPVFPQIDRNNLSNTTKFVSAPKYHFSIDPQDTSDQEQTTSSNQEVNSSSPKNSTSKGQANKNEKLAKAISKVKPPQIYQNQQLGFSFKYPKGYVLNKAQHKPRVKSRLAQQRIDVWSNADYQAIKAGKFQGSELPANVSISVEENPKRLSARKWLKENNDEFGSTENQSKQKVAGQKAVVFRSSGLYETQNIVLPSKDGKKLILISHSQGQNDSDKDYEEVFEQVVSSFELRTHE